jgi:hypothetical protein
LVIILKIFWNEDSPAGGTDNEIQRIRMVMDRYHY